MSVSTECWLILQIISAVICSGSPRQTQTQTLHFVCMTMRISSWWAAAASHRSASASAAAARHSNSRCSLIIRWTTYYYSEHRTQSRCCLKLTAGRTHTDLNYYRLLWTVFCFTSPRDSALLSGQSSLFSVSLLCTTNDDWLPFSAHSKLCFRSTHFSSTR